MKKIYKYVVLSPIILGCASGLTSCAKSSEKFTLKIINSEDYIYLNDDDPTALPDMVDQFKMYVKELVKEGKLDPKYRNVDVVYDTSDTNETLYSELQTGKSDYDLINVSDYMAQKMVSEGLVVPLYRDEDGERREDKVPNYVDYASKTLRERLDNIEAPIYSKWIEDPENPGKKVHPHARLEDYAVGYMWGTLGILFNPNYEPLSGRVDEKEMMNDMHYSFSALWNTKYKGTISIKNSMRDTFAAGLMHAYESDFAELKAKYDAGTYDAEKYMEEYAKVFNGENEAKFSTVVNKVHNALNTLKDNIFGLEVDSGKQDIVTGKIGVNLAWSGDAVYSMDLADEEDISLYYCVPELGSNLWFDTWVMPKNKNRSEERRELALMFLDFMSDPANAMQNMDYTGYTPFIGGKDIVDLARNWFDIRYSEVYETVDEEDYLVYAYKDEDFFEMTFDRCLLSSDKDKNNYGDYALRYFEPYEVEDEETGEMVTVEEPRTVAELVDHGEVVYVKNDNDEPTTTPKTYNDVLFADEEYDEIDLSYFFNDTFDTESGYRNDIDTIFYSDSYYADVFEDEETHECYVEDADGTRHANTSVGRQFFTQYPDEETIMRCAVMKDFGENNKLVMKMWEEFKSDPLPTPAIVIFVIIIGAALGLIGFIVAGKILTNRIRKKRKKAQN